MATSDPLLKQFRAALDEMYGARLERIVLFGSRARGEARPDSDYDVAVFLKDYTDRLLGLQLGRGTQSDRAGQADAEHVHRKPQREVL